MKLLIIRPQPGADATARRAEAIGIETVVEPFFAVEPLDWDVPDLACYDALMLTSANAVIHIGAMVTALKHLPVLAVGMMTAVQAKAAGLTVKLTGDAGVAELLQSAALAGHKHILWLAGADHTPITPPIGMTVDVVAVYQSHALSAPKTLLETLRQPALTALHSARAASYFAKICQQNVVDKSTQSLIALSPAVAASAGKGWRAVIIADAPNDDSLLSAASSFFTNPPSAP